MRILISELRQIIREELLEEAKKPRYTTIRGRKVKYGSAKHLQELEQCLERVGALRERQKRGSGARQDITRVISRLKNEIGKVKKYRDRLELVK